MVVLAMAIVLVVAACGSDDPTAAPTAKATPPPPPTATLEPGVTAAPTATSAPSPTATPADGYYNGKTLRIVVNYEAGSSADLFARMVARNLPPEIDADLKAVVVNRGGGGGAVGANYVFAAKPDGLTIGMFSAISPSFQGSRPGVEFDVRKFNPILGLQGQLSAWYVRADAPYDRLQDAIGKGSAGGERFTVARDAQCGVGVARIRMVIEALDLPLDIAFGLPGGRQQGMQQLERGDIDSVTQSMWYTVASDRPGWLKNRFLEMFAIENPPGTGDYLFNGEIDMPADTKYVYDLLPEQSQKEAFLALSADNLGPTHRTIHAPPGTPAELVEVLRSAAWDMVNGDAWKADYLRVRGFDPLDPRTGAEMVEIYETALSGLGNISPLLEKYTPDCPNTLG
jgi:tripartite-type tricarboxylate transporter receptor subunit TctC